ncbi:MAG: VOC family protein [Anaerolineae bacterium]|nr:VOC family protein [Anaerolineae bacterium]
MQRPPIEQQVTFLYTADLAATAVFYESILQLPLVLDQGVCRIYATGGDAYLGFCQALSTEAGSLPPTQGIILTLVSPEVDAWYEYLQAHHVPIEKPPTRNTHFNIYQLFARDPNGYLIEIQTFLDPQWPKPVIRNP